MDQCQKLRSASTKFPTNKKSPDFSEDFVAEWTGLEPATPCVTGMYSNQLNYHSVVPFGSANIDRFLYNANKK